MEASEKFGEEIKLFGFEDKEILDIAKGLDNQITAGIWNSAHEWKSFRSHQVHALLQRFVLRERELEKRISQLEERLSLTGKE